MAQLYADFFAKVTSLLFDVNYKFNNGNLAFIITYIYIISYMLPWVLRPKKYYHLEIYSLSFKGSMVFRITAFGQSSGMKLLYLHARNALE